MSSISFRCALPGCRASSQQSSEQTRASQILRIVAVTVGLLLVTGGVIGFVLKMHVACAGTLLGTGAALTLVGIVVKAVKNSEGTVLNESNEKEKGKTKKFTKAVVRHDVNKAINECFTKKKLLVLAPQPNPPPAIWNKICGYLDVKDLVKMGEVNGFFNTVVERYCTSETKNLNLSKVSSPLRRFAISQGRTWAQGLSCTPRPMMFSYMAHQAIILRSTDGFIGFKIIDGVLYRAQNSNIERVTITNKECKPRMRDSVEGNITAWCTTDDKIIYGDDKGRIGVCPHSIGKSLFFINDEDAPNKGFSLLQAAEGKIISVAKENCQIKIWDLNDEGKYLRSLVGHSKAINCLKVFDGHLFSGDEEGVIRVWNLNNGGCVTFQDGKDPIRQLEVTEDAIFAACGTRVKKWDRKSGKCLFTSLGHKKNITHLQVTDDAIITGSSIELGVIKKWDRTTGDCLFTLNARGRLTSLKLTEDAIVASTLTPINGEIGHINIWDLESGAPLGDYDEKRAGIRDVEVVDNKIFAITFSDLQIWEKN